MLVSTGSDSGVLLIPLKNSVHEVLKRLCTSGSILQTALCCPWAARSKVPEIRPDDGLGITSYLLPDSASQEWSREGLAEEGARLALSNVDGIEVAVGPLSSLS